VSNTSPFVVGIDANPGKQEIVRDLGERSLVLPVLLNRGLEANDRAKYLLALFQAARAHAESPEQPFSTLSDERRAAGLTDEQLDTVVAAAHAGTGGSFFVPGAASLRAELVAAVGEMLEPLALDDASAETYGNRLAHLVAEAPDLSSGWVPEHYVDQMTAAERGAADSLHLLIMDAHRALNHLQAEVATEVLDGASVYRLPEEDRSLVAAFMAGVHTTEAVKFDHPGLATTATRSGGRLLIQNDIGTTAAHVFVLAIEGLSASLTYTDDHLERLLFFESMLDSFPMTWSDAQHRHRGGALGEHFLVTGRYDAPDRASLERLLRHLGSRLVFLIDWNRARKRLASVVKKREAVALLVWAAENGYGHMAFLLMGGERLLYDAVEQANRVPSRYGEPLRDVLGPVVTIDILRFALRSTSEGMRAGKSQLLIRDELRVELLRHVQAAERHLFDTAAEHGSLVVETAQTLRAALVGLGLPDADDFLRRASTRAARFEHRADEILRSVRLDASRLHDAGLVVSTVSCLDDAIDDLEEALFLLTVLPSEATAVVRPILDALAGIAVSASREHLKALEIARELIEGPGEEDLEDFLVALDQVATLEHEADRAERTARAALVGQCPDFRSLHVSDLISRAMEDATDALSLSALHLRDHILGKVMAR
jgi:uncharacterized protein Yka (UPF0111/DUF47 family)